METTRPDSSQLIISLIITAWEMQNARVDKLLSSWTDEQWMKETAPGRNTGHYLLGHLAAVNDAMFPLLGFGEKHFPELEKIFLSNPDGSGLPKPPMAELREKWKIINADLTAYVKKLSSQEWLMRHNSVSPEDFAKEPHRNRLNILVGRANHQSYHLGQLNYLVKK